MLLVFTSIFVLSAFCFLETEDKIYANPQQVCTIYHTMDYINLYKICLVSFKQIYIIF